MKRSFIFLVMLLFSGLVTAEVRVNSFYFHQNSIELTGTSRCLLDELQQFTVTHDVQIIEINSFSALENSKEANIQLARQRLKFISNALAIDLESKFLNVYGDRRVELNFIPLNWERVDVYFFIGEQLEVIAEKIDEVEKHQAINETDSLAESNEIIEDRPITLMIKFKGGTVKIQMESYIYLESLYQSLIARPDLNAHIRGHVCCGNKKYRSKRRAKAVYDYLKNRGISKERLSFKGYSNSEPLIFPEVTDEDRSANRRVDVIFSRGKNEE